jgi:hypothetical protein
MRTALLGLASCLALFSGTSVSAADPAVDYLVLVGKVKEAQKAFEANKPTEPIFQDIKSTLPAFQDAAQDKRERLQRAIDDLIERAKHASLILEDFWRLQAMIIDAKCCTAIRQLWVEAKERKATREQFERMCELLRQRADAAKEHPDLRQMLQNEINKLMKRYLASEKIADIEYTLVDDETIRVLLDRGLAWLEDMAVKRHATREQFLYVKDLMMDRARKFSEDVEWRGLMQRVDAELERLMNRDLSTSGFSREDFAKLREMCMTKARAAAGGAVGS